MMPTRSEIRSVLIRVLIVVVLIALIWAAAARGSVTRLWVPLQLTPGARLSSGELSGFDRVSGWPGQASGSHFWTYVKGARSYDRNLPESWYLHVAGVRVRDKTYHSYVMDPSIRGWQEYVAAECPARCFIDGVGSRSLDRMEPRPDWTTKRWLAAVHSLLSRVAKTSSIVPNSIQYDALTLADVSGHFATEAWTSHYRAILHAGRVWVKTKHCDTLLGTYLLWRGSGDRLYCDMGGQPWTIPAVVAGPPVGHALSDAERTRSGWRRAFRHAVVTVTGTGYQIRYR